MSSLVWQKSTYSSEGNNCLELAVGLEDAVLLRESDEPFVIVTVSSRVLGGLVRSVQGDVLAR
ncbi:DUF397 domain-containing protein [Streptomyces chrestomyceticus]|uniref:DUF397 domain-containing protein n=1 Tax=Streptomyces chrestomyceticus TaxID=68185 RepID=A0ABU7WNI2_9ACTN